METVRTVTSAISQGDWMEDAYLRVPIHPDSWHFLRFTCGSIHLQFWMLCFGLFPIIIRLMAPVSTEFHHQGFHILRYLDDWLLPVASCKGLDETSLTLVFSHSSGSGVEEENVPSTNPTQPALGYQLLERSGVVARDPELGAGSTPPVGHPRPLSLHKCLKRQVGCIPPPGVSVWPLRQPEEAPPHQCFGTQDNMSGVSSLAEVLRDLVVVIFSDNTTALAFLNREGGTHSSLLNNKAQEILD
ncbi:hypothetical protein E2C01_042615 [Portunus trituberculatus]|uniref:Reverse transcriptase domain-containing protein n=1 Tax=Portunus trituberculatus TaxID=210409 RepID=A0A5B7FMV8_PORTR|nr:hypothetical protein [Portunus trituberculatus]